MADQTVLNERQGKLWENMRSGQPVLYVCAAMITVLLPWLIDFCMLRFLGHGIFDVVPYFNDEVNYWHLVADMLEYGKPIGYMGFYGTHAPVGTFGFHGFVILLPYYLFARIFGLHFYTLAVCNMALVSLALLLLIVLLRLPVKNMLVTGALITLPSMVSKFYSTSMLEGLNVFLAVAFGALFVKILDTGRRRYMAAAWLLMVFAVLAKVTWVICVPPLAMVCLKGGLRRRATGAGLLTAVVSLAGYQVYSLFSAPYYQSKFMDFRDVFAERGVVKGSLIMLRETFYDLFRPMLIALRGQDGEGSLEVLNGLLLYGMFLALALWVLRLLYIKYIKKQDIYETTGLTGRQTALLAAAFSVMAMDLAGVAVLYMPIQTIRTAFHSYLFAVVLLSAWNPDWTEAAGHAEKTEKIEKMQKTVGTEMPLKSEKPVKPEMSEKAEDPEKVVKPEKQVEYPAAIKRVVPLWLRGLPRVFLLLSFASTVTLCVTGDGFGEKLFWSEQFQEEYDQTRAFLGQYIHLDESQVGWRNTVAYMEGTPELYWMCMPPGTGLNYHVWLSPEYEEQWAMMSAHPEGVYDYDTIYSSFVDAGYQELDRDEKVVLFVKK